MNALTIDSCSFDNAARLRAGPAALLSGVWMLTGLSHESQQVRCTALWAADSYLSVLSVPLPLEYAFAVKAVEWRADTKFYSSPEMATNHPAYKSILAMGKQVIPLIFREMEKEPGLWFEALMALTDAQPVPVEHAGDIDAMTADWLAWGRQNGLHES